MVLEPLTTGKGRVAKSERKSRTILPRIRRSKKQGTLPYSIEATRSKCSLS